MEARRIFHRQEKEKQEGRAGEGMRDGEEDINDLSNGEEGLIGNET